jgi:type II secretory pathway pseudopilin PulG
MRGRWASAAIGASVARNRASSTMNQQAQANQAQQQAAQNQIEAQQRQIEALQQQQQQPQPQTLPQQEDVTQKLQKYADLHQKGILSDDEFQKLKADLLAKM